MLLLRHSVPNLFFRHSSIDGTVTLGNYDGPETTTYKLTHPVSFLQRRAVDAFILMGSPCVGFSPFFFMSYKAARRNETRVVSSHRHYINFKLFIPISADMPTTIESRSLKCNFFNLAGNTAPRACRRCPVLRNRGTVNRTLCAADKMSGQFAAALNGGIDDEYRRS